MSYSASGFLPDTDATDRLGMRLARDLRPGDVVFLTGQIGAGKTHLVRATIQALFKAEGIDGAEVPSPTYTLVQTYELSRATVWHADLYRLGDPSEIAELGLDDAFLSDISFVEWPEMIETLPDNLLTIHLSADGDGRVVKLESSSARWSSLQSLLDDNDA